MLPALSLTGADAMTVPASSPQRVNKLLAAGAAMVTAGALAASPITPSMPTGISLPAAAQRAVELAAVANPIASPFVVYPEILTNTVTNLENLGEAIAANPLPLLKQVLTNQAGYAQSFFNAVGSIPANWEAYSTGTGGGTSGGATYLAEIKQALADGNSTALATAASSYVLFGLLVTLQPVYNTILTHTTRGVTGSIPGIPQEIAQNFANLVGAVFSSTTFVNGIFESVWGAAGGTTFAIAQSVFDIADAAQTGNVAGAINGLINLPGVTVDAILNGWQHPSAQAPWPALLTYQNTGTYATTSIGLLGQLLVKIPAAIAKAITPTTTTTASSTAAVESASAAATSVESTATTASSTTTASEATEQTAAADTTTASTETAAAADEKSSASASSATSRTTAAKKSSTSSTKASDSTSAGTKKGGSGHSARAKASASKSSGSSD